MREDKPDVPNLAVARVQDEQDSAPPSKALVPVEQPDDGTSGNVAPRERYWTEDRLVRLGFMALYAVFAVGLVVAFAAWPVIDEVPWLPWLVGMLAVAAPAWKAYSELAEEQKGRRIRAERDRNGFGVSVTAPRDRHAG